MSWYWTYEFDNVREMVLIPGVIVSTVRLEQVVAGGHFERHAGCGPNVGRRSVPGAKQDLKTSVLAGLDVLREVVMLEKEEETNDRRHDKR